MRPLLSLVLLCATGAIFTACTSDMESPFAMTKEKWKKTVIVEVKANDGVKVQGSRVKIPDLGDVFQKYALEQPGREVTLLIERNSDPLAEGYVRRAAASAGLGKVTLATPDDLRRREEMAPPAEKTPEPAKVTTPPLSTGAIETAPPPAVYDAGSVTVELSANSGFTINGVPVAKEKIGEVLAKIAKENPGKPVSLVAQNGASLRDVTYLSQEAEKAGLGAVTAK